LLTTSSSSGALGAVTAVARFVRPSARTGLVAVGSSLVAAAIMFVRLIGCGGYRRG
jgi:hypothetical protein